VEIKTLGSHPFHFCFFAYVLGFSYTINEMACRNCAVRGKNKNKNLVLLQVCPVWRLHWHLRLLLLHLLLPRALRHVGLHANIFLLRLHDLRLLRFLPHAGHCRLSHVPAVRAAHLPVHQVRVTWTVVSFALVLSVAGAASEPNRQSTRVYA
jgi:hypothetical protein